MIKLAALLRGINVSGQKQIKMDDLKSCFTGLGFTEVTTYIQSGNVIFKSVNTDIKKITETIESGIEKSFGYNVEVILRNSGELKNVIDINPYLKGNDTKKTYVTFLKDNPENTDLDPKPFLPEEFSIIGKEVFLFCPNGYGKSKLSNNFFEKKLKVSGTTRNWNSVIKLYDLSKEDK